LISYEDWQRIEADLREWIAYKAKQFGDKTPKKTFNAVKLDTQDFKFNRNEANER